VAGIQGRHAEAQHSFQLGLAIDRQLDNAKGICTSLQNLGTIAWIAGKHRQAESYLQEAVVLSQEIGLRKVLTGCLNTLGNVAADQHNYDEARERFHQALATAAESNDIPFMLEILVGIARLLGMHEGEPEQARELAMLVLENPASDHNTRSTAEELLGELDKLLPEPKRSRASSREPRLPLDAAVAGILSDNAMLASQRDAW
jgi:tetratricopeptide (TPR) repeat protein